jgi:hypothetical protein
VNDLPVLSVRTAILEMYSIIAHPRRAALVAALICVACRTLTMSRAAWLRLIS